MEFTVGGRTLTAFCVPVQVTRRRQRLIPCKFLWGGRDLHILRPPSWQAAGLFSIEYGEFSQHLFAFQAAVLAETENSSSREH